MKTIGWLCWGLLCSGVMQAAEPVTEAFQKALFEEEARQDPAAALEAYQEVLSRLAEYRKLEATVLYRMGECYRKLGRTNEAVTAYQRVVQQFGEQATLVRLATENLRALKPEAVSPGKAVAAPPVDPEDQELRRIQNLVQNSPDLINALGTNHLAPLHEAAWNGYLRVAQFLLDHGADVNGRAEGPDGPTALHYAVLAGHLTMVKLLLAHGSSPTVQGRLSGDLILAFHAKDCLGWRGRSDQTFVVGPLHGAAAKGFIEIAQVLLDHKVDVNVRAADGATPLRWAVRNGHLRGARFLIEHGANVNAEDQKGWRPLHEVAQCGSVDMAELLLAHGAEVDPKNERGETPAVVAAQTSNPVLGVLLAHGADPNAECSYGTITHLVLGNAALLRTLLEYKPDLERKDKEGLTPLQYAVYLSSPPIETFRLLIEAGANVNATYDAEAQSKMGGLGLGMGLTRVSLDGLSPLHVAVIRMHLDLIEVLLQAGANIDAQGQDGRTRLHYAVITRNPYTLSKLFAHKPNINLRDEHGKTALALAVEEGWVEGVKALLKAGSDPTLQDDDGRNALHLAVHTGNEEIIELLLKTGAQLNVPDKQGRKPWDHIPRSPRLDPSTGRPLPGPSPERIERLLREYGYADKSQASEQRTVRKREE